MTDPFDEPVTWLYMRITEHSTMKKKKSLARNGEAVLTPNHQLPHRRTE
jgi:hypothetical protein